MVYRFLDPGRDWDAWCDDHPDDPDPDKFDQQYHEFSCPCCYVTAQWEEVECGDYFRMADNGDVFCHECYVDGAHPLCEVGVNLEAWRRDND